MVAKQNAVRAPRRRQADRREAAETALLEAAISLIAARGVKGTTLADVNRMLTRFQDMKRMMKKMSKNPQMFDRFNEADMQGLSSLPQMK